MSLRELLEKKFKFAADEKESPSLLAEKRQQAVSPGLVKWLLSIAAPTPAEELMLAMLEWNGGDMGQNEMVFDPQQDWTGGDPQVAVDLCRQIDGMVTVKTVSPREVEIWLATTVTEEENESQYYQEFAKQQEYLHDWIRKALEWDRHPRKRLAGLLVMAGGRVPDIFSPMTTYLEKTDIPPTEQDLYDLLHEYPRFTDVKLQVCRSHKLTKTMERYDRAQVQSAVAQWQLAVQARLVRELSGGRKPVVVARPGLRELLEGSHLDLEEDSQDE